uniref:Wzy n=1 Tax=Proteus vulgaris TaxID=585 RepID=A0A385JNG6_PROVU|nr:wzy [Proteus vulgaris]
MAITYIIYNLILISSTFFIFIAEKRKAKTEKIIYTFISFSIIFIPAAIRYNIGADYFSYVNIFNEIKFNSDNYNKEIGFYFLNKLLIYLDADVQWLFVITSFIIYSFVYASYPYKNKALFHFIFITTFYLVSYNLVRTAIVYSISIYILSILLFQKKNIFLILSFIIIAFLFHKSAILILTIPLLYIIVPKRIFNFRSFSIICLISLVLFFLFRERILNIIFNLSIIKLLGYDKYIHSIYASKVEYNSGIGIILSIVPFLIIIAFSKELNNENIKNNLIIIGCFIYIFAIICNSTFIIFSRVERLFIFIIPLSLIVFLECKKIHRIIRGCFLIYVIFWYTLSFEMNINIFRSTECAGSRISPYVSIFNKEDDHSLKIVHSECLKQER